MVLDDFPDVATWRHHSVRSGFEVLFSATLADGRLLRGHTTAVEGGVAWSVGYRIELDPQWRTVRVETTSSTTAGERRMVAERIDGDRWLIDGQLRPDLTGCVDVDFESSAVTNTLPVHRIPFVPGGARHAAPAAFVRADDLRVERIEQEYTPLEATDTKVRFAYESSTFDVACTLTFDAAGLILDYPGIAVRVG